MANDPMDIGVIPIKRVGIQKAFKIVDGVKMDALVAEDMLNRWWVLPQGTWGRNSQGALVPVQRYHAETMCQRVAERMQIDTKYWYFYPLTPEDMKDPPDQPPLLN